MNAKKSILTMVLAAAVGLSMSYVILPQAAKAADGSSSSVVSQLSKSTKESLTRYEHGGSLQDQNVFRSDSSTAKKSTRNISLPSSFDLRSRGVVTPVKLQNPWGTCWAFGGTAAAETSILSELKTTYKKTKLDLSEHHLAWFRATPLTSGSQKGEGYFNKGTLVSDPTTKEAAQRMNSGNCFVIASVYASGMGPVSESAAPYKNKEGRIHNNNNDLPFCYSENGDWSLDESLRFTQSYQLEESNLLPSPLVKSYDKEGNITDIAYDPTAVDAVKRELYAGRGVEVAYFYNDKYINNKTWAHYVCDNIGDGNHAVCIVGWDDDYPAANFSSTDSNGKVQRPAGNGAFIIKNSWGSAGNAFPNKTGWGNDGYFYLSYYDKSMTALETFDFITDQAAIKEHSLYYANEYDFMPVSAVNVAKTDTPAYMANVFTAEADENIRTISCESAKPGSTITYELYKLKDDYKDPEDGTLMYSAKKTYPYGGYHSINFNDNCTVAKNDKFAVVIMEKTANGKFVVLNNGGNSVQVSQSSYFAGVINRGESYLYDAQASGWTDWKDGADKIISENDGEVTLDNFAIKAYGDPIVKVARVSRVKARALGKSRARVSWKKAAGVSGYQIAVKKAGKKYKYTKVSRSKSGRTFRKLAKNRKYCFKVRAYKVRSGRTYYGKWSTVKKVRIK